MRSLILVLLMWSAATAARGDEALQAELQVFAPFVGKTWRGELNGSTPERKLVDVSHWERALNGTAIRILHSVNDGEYGGESIVFWDAARKQIRYYYFTTAGFYTEGSMTVENNHYTSSESVSGDSSGITEVRGTGTLLPDGSLRQDASYLQNGQWVQGHSATYRPAPGAELKFR